MLDMQPGKVRVGRIEGKKYPSYPGFKSIVVMTKSSPYGDIGPYVLKNEQGQLMENIYQFSKVYETVPKSKQIYSRWDNRVIWDCPSEKHVEDGEVNDAYWKWREAGMNAKEAIRYPVGMKHRGQCLYALWEGEKLNYVQARKEIYMKTYKELVMKEPKFIKLKKWLKEGKNLLIIEIDGPHQESLDYYKQKYNVQDDFIEQSTMLATKENLEIMLNDTRHNYGHAYCLSACLQDIDL
jgi:hypothetical protein